MQPIPVYQKINLCVKLEMLPDPDRYSNPRPHSVVGIRFFVVIPFVQFLFRFLNVNDFPFPPEPLLDQNVVGVTRCTIFVTK